MDATEHTIGDPAAPARFTTAWLAGPFRAKAIIELAVLGALPRVHLAFASSALLGRGLRSRAGLPQFTFDIGELGAGETEPESERPLLRHTHEVPRDSGSIGKREDAITAEFQTVTGVVAEPGGSMLHVGGLDRFKELA